MEEDLRGYLDWITQAEDLDAEPTCSSTGNSAGKDNGAGNSRSRKASRVIAGLIRSSIPLPMVVINEGIWQLQSWQLGVITPFITFKESLCKQKTAHALSCF